MKKAISIFLSLLSFLSYPCEVRGPKNIFRTEERSPFGHLITFKKCDESKKEKFLEFANDLNGEINQRITSLEVPGVFLNQSFNVSTLEDMVNSRVNTPKNWRLINVKLTGTKNNIISLTPNQSLLIDCLHCENTGEKTLKATISDPIEGTKQYVWLKADLAVRTQSLVAKRTLNVSNNPLKPSDFEEKITFSKNPDRLFTNKNQLVFYKLNKGKSQGEEVLYNDITPVNLVRIGQPVTILLNNNGLTLEGKATANQSGKLGQVIRLKNTRTNKTIIGKIIDFNKVEVQL